MEEDFDWLSWLDTQGGGDLPQGSYDIDDLLTGYMSDPSLFGYYTIDDPANYPRSESNPGGYDPSASYNQPLPAGASAGSSIIKKLQDAIKSGLGGSAGDIVNKGIDLATSKGGIAAITALLSALDRQKPSGGGTTMAYQGPRQYTRTVAPGATGTPIARYAANGGMMHAYANGGHVQMEDGGFVMTKRAVDGAGGPRGIQQLVPGARMIRGPGTGTSDSIPAVINGRNGQTPARLSNGEAYVPRAVVQQAGGPKQMYALMNSLQRKA